ncbi:S-layer homology domain-containing protein [Cohnella sp. GCM10027633]|uniref:S-layer homology domain-containing protein n=1 Tax=unclassified Cohnella TaxID=2636738 RepID=UPI003627DD4B
MKYRNERKFPKWLLCMLIVLAPITGVFQPVGSAYANDGFAGGTGTTGDPYLIATPAQFDLIRSKPTSAFKLVDDIDLGDYASGAGWVPIGSLTLATRFKGTLDGDGYTITNLRINRPATNYIGLFGYVYGGTIKNLNIAGAGIIGGDNVGVLAGYSEGIFEGQQSAISNSGVSGGSVTGKGTLGGLVGNSSRGTIESSYSSASVTGSGYSLGGLVGFNGSSSTIRHSYATGNVAMTASPSSTPAPTTYGLAIGGLVGTNAALNGMTTTISNSYATGEAKGLKHVGGLVGRSSADANSNTTISNSYATGRAIGTERIGGLVGYNDYGKIDKSYAIGIVEGTDQTGGLVGGAINEQISSSYYDREKTGITVVSDYSKSTEEMKSFNTYAGWDLSNAWRMAEGINGGYPYLPAQALNAVTSLGQGAGTTKATAATLPGHRLVVQVSSDGRATPRLGESVPATDVIDPYVSGSDIGGVDATTNKYVNLYETNAGNKVLKFANIMLTSADILTYTINELEGQTLSSLTVGYASGSQQAKTITVTRTGTGDLTNLSATVSGNDFLLTPTPLADTTLNAATPSTDLTVTAKDGLPVGTHTATVTVSADGMADETFEVTQVVVEPGAPALLTPIAGNARVTLQWDAVAAATGYEIFASATSGSYDDAVAAVGSNERSYDVTGLSNGVTYYFTVKAMVDDTASAASNEVSATPKTVPGAPTDVTATAGSGQATVSFTAPSDDGGSPITSYTVKASPGNRTASGSGSSIVVTGLSNGTAYTFTVIASNGEGDGPASEASSSVTHPIGVPVLETPVAGNKQITLQWDAVDDVTGYRIYKSTVPGTYGIPADTLSNAADRYVFTGLTNGISYYFTIRAVNDGVEGAASAEVSAIPTRGPGAPAGTFAGGAGTDEDPYRIATAAQLNAVRDYAAYAYKLTADISLSGYADGEGWLPIGDVDSSFGGNMDGDGHAITGLTIHRPNADYVGLFGYVRGKIANLKLDNVDIEGKDYVGGLAGYVKNGTISNSDASGTVVGLNDVGGLVGHVERGTIGNSYSAGSVTGLYRVGGLAGYNVLGTIGDCYSEGNVTGIADSFYIGGLVGRNEGVLSGEQGTIINSYATGNAAGDNQVGGLVGQNHAATIQASYATGEVAAIWYAGGLAGMNQYGIIRDSYTKSRVTVQEGILGGFTGYQAGTTVNRNYAAGSVTGGTTDRGGFAGSYVGAIPGSNYYDQGRIGLEDTFASPVSTTLMKAMDTYADWDLDQTWGMDSVINDGYPYLRYLAPDLQATAAPGDIGGTTTISATPDFGNHLVVRVSSSPISVPGVRASVPAAGLSGVTNPYIAGSNISGVDASTNKYVGVYEADDENQVVRFTILTLTSEDIRPRTSTPTGPGTPTGPPVTPTPSTFDLGDANTGAILRVIADVRTSASGTTFADIEVDTQQLTQLLDALNGKNAAARTATIAVEGGADQVEVNLPTAALLGASAANAQGTLIIATDAATYEVPLSLLRELSGKFTGSHISIAINKPAGQSRERIIAAAESQGLLLASNPVEFKVTAGDQEVTEFDGVYVERTVGAESRIDPSKATAAWFDPISDTFHFVPSLFEIVDGKTVVVMKSPHNSTYTVIRTAKTFTDLNGHWAKADVESLASKLIVSGVSGTSFAPNGNITRAEFVALLVRSLGLSLDTGATDAPFADVTPGDWYAGAIQAAVRAKLVDGFADNRFKPNDKITREQMAIMVARALALAGRTIDVASEQDELLAKFQDQASISGWARTAVAQSVEADIIAGMTDKTFVPSANASRAQAVVMLRRFLQYVEFID